MAGVAPQHATSNTHVLHKTNLALFHFEIMSDAEYQLVVAGLILVWNLF